MSMDAWMAAEGGFAAADAARSAQRENGVWQEQLLAAINALTKEIRGLRKDLMLHSLPEVLPDKAPQQQGQHDGPTRPCSCR